MNPDYVRAIYLDLEWTCLDGKSSAGVTREILELGAVELDLASLQFVGEEEYLIRPRDLAVSARCTTITGITTAHVRWAPRFPEVVNAFVNRFNPAAALCVTWGDDARVFAEACSSYGIKNPLRRILDLSQFYRQCFLLQNQPSVERAINMLGAPFAGTAHMALADARNTAEIHSALLRRLRGSAASASPVGSVADPIAFERFTK